MSGIPYSKDDIPDADALRAQAENTRRKLGETVDALAAKADVADVKARARQTAAEVKGQATEKAAQARAQLADTAATVSEKLRDTAPQPVLDTTQRVTESARVYRTPLLAGAVVVVAVLLVARSRRR
ncbi:DUF3618 domain-containing protein [Streptomyces sp. NPDC020965]|uniref:DUF3618 domain-containing protein n=1 Tax=Streptomyces sp. NPDC020965 TaxID=3365105 RepID=UPI0037BB1526